MSPPSGVSGCPLILHSRTRASATWMVLTVCLHCEHTTDTAVSVVHVVSYWMHPVAETSQHEGGIRYLLHADMQ